VPKKDANQKAAKHLADVTGRKKPKGESLLGSADLKRQLREAKKRVKR
jgi:hypothetical protein